MAEQFEPIDDPVGRIDLTDLELADAEGGTLSITIGVASLVFCSQRTLCGTCGVNTTGCC